MKITVFCNAGLSSGLIVERMRKISPDDDINAFQSTKMEVELPKADVVLVSPALRFMLSKAEKLAKPYGIPCGVIDMKAYGFGDGEAVYKQAVQMKEKADKEKK